MAASPKLRSHGAIAEFPAFRRELRRVNVSRFRRQPITRISPIPGG
jgi:hypothetical protein